MKIRCQIVDFVGLKPKSSSSSATTKRNTKSRNGAVPEQLLSPADMTVLHPLIQWTQIYFQSGSPPTEWDEAYESEANSSGLPHDEPEFIPPVYFQQDGHSRTLIGNEPSQHLPVLLHQSTLTFHFQLQAMSIEAMGSVPSLFLIPITTEQHLKRS